MGAANSKELLSVPLHAQGAPAIGTDPSCCLPRPVSMQALRVKWYSSKLAIVDTATNVEHFRILTAGMSWSGRRTFYGPDGQALLHIKAKSFSRTWRVFRGEHSDELMFEIVVKTRLASIDFRDQTTGQVARISTEQSYDDRVALVVLERNGKRQPVARIRRPKTGAFEHEDFFFEIAPGVDTLLVTLLWFVRFEYLERQRRQQQQNSAAGG